MHLIGEAICPRLWGKLFRAPLYIAGYNKARLGYSTYDVILFLGRNSDEMQWDGSRLVVTTFLLRN